MQIIRPFTVTDASLTSSIGENVDYANYSASVAYVTGDTVIGTDFHEYESQQGTSKGAATITIASPGVVTSAGHGLVANTPILFTTTGALPTGLSANTIYYVANPSTDTFEVAATSGGASINTSGSQSGTHTLIANPNFAKALSDAAWWLDLGFNRKWRMFDLSNSSQSSASDSIDVSIVVDGRVNSVSLLNIAADTVQIIATADAAEVYNETYNLTSDSGINNWYDYFFEPIIRKGDLVVTDIPLNADPTIQVILTATGSTVRVGTLIVGQGFIVGATVYGARVGIQDYSRKVADDFGNWTIVERAFAKRATFKIIMDSAKVDATQALLASLRALPVVYQGTAEYASTFIFGFFKDFSIEIDKPSHSYCNLEIEGLT